MTRFWLKCKFRVKFISNLAVKRKPLNMRSQDFWLGGQIANYRHWRHQKFLNELLWNKNIVEWKIRNQGVGWHKTRISLKVNRNFCWRSTESQKPAGQPVSDRPGRPVFLQKVFVHCSIYPMKNFPKGGHGWNIKICDFGRGSQKNKQKKLLRFLQEWLIFKTFFG